MADGPLEEAGSLVSFRAAQRATSHVNAQAFMVSLGKTVLDTCAVLGTLFGIVITGGDGDSR